jgi:hypothetical protein
MGLPPELDELINSMEPFYGRTREDVEREMGNRYEEVKKLREERRVGGSDTMSKEEFVKLATDDWFEKNKPVDIKSRLSNLLATGVNNVPDATANFDFVWGAEGGGEYKRWGLMFA